MSAAPSKIVPLTTPAFVASMERARYQGWRRFLEAIITGAGVRATLVHVPDAVWIRHYAANEDACSAVLAELVRVAD